MTVFVEFISWNRGSCWLQVAAAFMLRKICDFEPVSPISGHLFRRVPLPPLLNQLIPNCEMLVGSFFFGSKTSPLPVTSRPEVSPRFLLSVWASPIRLGQTWETVTPVQLRAIQVPMQPNPGGLWLEPDFFKDSKELPNKKIQKTRHVHHQQEKHDPSWCNRLQVPHWQL